MKKVLLLLASLNLPLLIVASALFATRPVLAASGREIASKALPSIVVLLTQDTAGRPLAMGSGFFVKGTTVVTNYHVIEGAAAGVARVVGGNHSFKILGTVAVDREHDLVLLKLSGASQASLSMTPLGEVAVGDEVYALGNPRGLEGSLSSGIVSGIRTIDASRLIQISAPISPGSSGGPVLDTNGRLVGVAVGTFNGGQNLNFCIPALYVQRLLGATSQPTPLPGQEVSGAGSRSIFDGLATTGTDQVEVSTFMWGAAYNYYFEGSMFESFSVGVKNGLEVPIGNVRILVRFLDPQKAAVDFADLLCDRQIPSGFTARCQGSVSHATRTLLREQHSVPNMFDPTITSQEYRDGGFFSFHVIDFDILR